MSNSVAEVRSSLDVLAPWRCAWQHRQLLRRLLDRDIQSRYRGTMLGPIWTALVPLAMLAVYTVIFGLLIQPKWQSELSNPLSIPFIYFSGLILFDFSFECVTRAASLMRDNRNYIKKVIVPVEILAWIVLLSSAFRLMISIGLLLIFYVAVIGIPPITTLAVLVVIVPLAFMILGAIWLVSALAVYVRDIAPILAVGGPVLMFLTPVFYPVAAVPAFLQTAYYVNPLTFAIETTRAALFNHLWPDLSALAVYWVVATMVSWFGHSMFMKLRPGFADVL